MPALIKLFGIRFIPANKVCSGRRKLFRQFDLALMFTFNMKTIKNTILAIVKPKNESHD
jgi:hypothetical protein